MRISGTGVDSKGYKATRCTKYEGRKLNSQDKRNNETKAEKGKVKANSGQSKIETVNASR